MKVKLLCNVLVPFAACLAIGGVRGSSIQKSDGDGNDNLVTCGSAIKLRHIESKKYFLKSMNHQWGPGSSGQQVVTLATGRSDPDALWQIREAHNKTACQMGAPIQCGDTIRLTHVTTGKNLHSHSNQLSPLSRHNNEVTGFGSDGTGDTLDNWRLECMQVKKDRADNDSFQKQLQWEKTTLVRFRHIDTNSLLASSSKLKLNQENCPHCPIVGDLEVSCKNRLDEYSIFRVDDGAFFRL